MTTQRPEQVHAALPKSVRISIVTPTRNAARFLRDCLESVAIQRIPNGSVEVEHLILDGGSQDETLAIASQYDVRFLDRPLDMGLVPAICLGFEQATGDLVAFLGADDVLLPHALERVARVYQSERREVIFGRSRWVAADQRSLGELSAFPRWCPAFMHASMGWCYATASATFVTPQIYRSLGGFDVSFTKLEDYEFVTRVLSRKIPFSTIQQPISLYRRHDDNESLQQDSTYWRDLDVIHQRYAPKNPWLRRGCEVLMKSWVYARNPAWAYHQLRGKFKKRKWIG
jgi:glycosyltransferase involved in cell wall biosynthesis